MEQRRDFAEVEQRLGVEVGELDHHVDETPVRPVDEVVLGDEPAVVLDAAHGLLELEQDEPAVGAELDHVALDLLGDAAHHLGPLEDGGDVAHRDEILDLEG